ncbi:MAG: UPF0758 domain-containing protein [Acidobacteriota bacterium]|nr:UPF0758 domain-containing protein [Acidobacteriota bacterium]
MPLEERPRERLLSRGAATLADAELVAILLRTGSRGHSVLELPRMVLADVGGLEGLMRSDVGALRVTGLGTAKMASLAAALELARRTVRYELALDDPLRDPAAVARYLDLRFVIPDQEVIGALYLDSRHRLVGEAEIFRGALNRATVEPRPILGRGLMLRAAGVLLFHADRSGTLALALKIWALLAEWRRRERSWGYV